jgi:Holliday junction resolvase-like predicted endonuclease
VHMDLKVKSFSKAKFKSINSVEFSKQEKAKQHCNMWKKKKKKAYQTYGV